VLVIYPADVVLFEGILVFYFPKIRDLFHMKLFVDTDSDTRLARRGEWCFLMIPSKQYSKNPLSATRYQRTWSGLGRRSHPVHDLRKARFRGILLACKFRHY